jgi:hypothetical protein
MLVGVWWDEQIRSPLPLKRTRALARGLCIALAGVAGATVLVLAAASLVPMDTWQSLLPTSLHAAVAVAGRVVSARPLSIFSGGLAVVFGLCACSRMLRVESWRGTFAGLAGVAVAVILLAQQVILPEVAFAKTQREFTTEALRVTGSAAPVFFYAGIDYGVLFYAGRHIPVYEGTLTDRAPRYLIMKEDTWEQARRTRDVPFERVRLRADERPRLGRRFILLRRVQP